MDYFRDYYSYIQSCIKRMDDDCKNVIRGDMNRDTLLQVLIDNGFVSMDEVIKEAQLLGNYYVIELGRSLKNAPVYELARIIIDGKNPWEMMDFIEYVPGAPVEELGRAIMASKNASAIYSLASAKEGKWSLRPMIDHISVDELADAIIATNNERFIREFADNIPDAPVAKLNAAIQNIRENGLEVVDAVTTPPYSDGLNYNPSDNSDLNEEQRRKYYLDKKRFDETYNIMLSLYKEYNIPGLLDMRSEIEELFKPYDLNAEESIKR